MMKSKLTTAVIVIMLLTVLLSGCSGKSNTDKDGNIKLSVEIFDRNNVPSSEGSLVDNRWVNYIKDAMIEQGINVDFVGVPRATETEKLIVLLGSNSAPDIVYTYDRDIFMKIASMGGLHDLGPYIDEFGKTLKEQIGEEVLRAGNISGKQYGIPALRENTQHYGTFIRQDWLDILGLEAPTNRDELIEVLYEFKINDPGNVGSERLIPFHIENTADVFGEASRHYDLMYSFLERSDELDYTTPYMLREGFYEFIEFANMLYQEGLAHKEFATFNARKNQEQVMQGIVGVFDDGATSPWSDRYLGVLKSNVPEAEITHLEVFQNADGHYYKHHYDKTGYYIMSPKTSKSPETVIKYLEWLAQDEIATILTFGIEGEHYEIIDNAPIDIDIEYNRSTLNYIVGDLSIIFTGASFLSDEQNATRLRLSKDPYAQEKAISREIINNDIRRDMMFYEEIPTLGKHLAQMYKVCDEYWVKMVSSTDLPTVYAEFMKEMDNMEIQKIMEERTAYYNEHVLGN